MQKHIQCNASCREDVKVKGRQIARKWQPIPIAQELVDVNEEQELVNMNEKLPNL